MGYRAANMLHGSKESSGAAYILQLVHPFHVAVVQLPVPMAVWIMASIDACVLISVMVN